MYFISQPFHFDNKRWNRLEGFDKFFDGHGPGIRIFDSVAILGSLDGERELLQFPRERHFPRAYFVRRYPFERGHPVTPRSIALRSQARLSPITGGCLRWRGLAGTGIRDRVS